MTNDELREFIANLAISQAETGKQIQELKISQAKTDKHIEETGKEVDKTTKQVQEMSKTLRDLGLNVDGISKNTGLEAEEFFFSSMQKEKTLNNIQFDSVMPNIRQHKDGRQHEIDIFLANKNSVGLVEVKNRVKDKDLEQLQKIVDNFYFFHPSFENHKIIPAIAGKIFPEHIQNKALKNGFVVIKQVGNHIEQRNPN